MASQDQAEAKELSLVGKVELRIALADSEAKLQTLLATYLCPLLLKLASPFKSVREKVISVCQHINTRTKNNSITLPVAGLLKQFKENSNSLVRHFDLLYFQQGLPLIRLSERLELLPVLLKGLSRNYEQSAQNTAVLFHVLLRLLPDLTLPPRGSKDDLALRSKCEFDASPEDAGFVAQWIGKLMLFNGTAGARNGPGLSTLDWEFLTSFGKTSAWSPSAGGLRLIDTKVAAAKFLASGAFTDNERFMPGLFACADTHSRIADFGEDILKRSIAAVSLEETHVVEALLSAYQGSRSEPQRLPARGPLKIKILGILCKSQLVTTYSDTIVQIVKEALSSSGDDPENSAVRQKGLEASKIRAQVFTFINWVARIASENSLSKIAPQLTGDLRLYIESQGWPRAREDILGKNSAEISSRNYGYETIGLLAKSCPSETLVEPNLDLLRWLFQSLVGDNSSPDSNISIEAALGSVLSILSKSDLKLVEEPLIHLLQHFMALGVGDEESGSLVHRSARYSVVRFVNRCLPYHNHHARWIDVISLSEGSVERHEILEEGKKGLDPFWYRNLNPVDIATKTTQDAQAFAAERYRMPDSINLITYFFGARVEDETKLGSALSTAVVFCRNILFHQALKSKDLAPDIDVEWERRLDALVSTDRSARECIRSYIRGQSDATSMLSQLLDLVSHALKGLITGGSGSSAASGRVLMELCSMGPNRLIECVAPVLKELLPILSSNKSDIQLISSQMFGTTLSSSSATQADRKYYTSKLLENIHSWEAAVGSAVHKVQGSILCLGFMFSRLFKKEGYIHELQAAKAEVLSLYMKILFKSRDKALIGAVLNALDQWAIFDILKLTELPADFDALKLITKLGEMAESGNEDAVSCLGHLAMSCKEDLSDDSLIMRINGLLIKLHEVRQPELHFGVGAALACLAAGNMSTSLSDVPDLDGLLPQQLVREKMPNFVIEQVLEKCKQTKPALRQASCIWLLCLVQFCGHLTEIQNRLRPIQKTFMRFLSDRDSLSQETASRGLGLVYEQGDRAVKEDLVRDLVSSFTSTGSNLAGTVSEDTQLFEAGALPTGDGSITTYKDIVNLANEVGDPSLVYRFMSLASNSSIWSSRAAFGRFGLSKILSDSTADGYLSSNPKLYPALFRYRFDPNTGVRSAMNEIWTTLVKDPTLVIESHFDKIMHDLLKNILGKEWRTRQASCAAIADLIQGRPLSKYESYLTEIWTATFKVCDDIKSSVREAAMSLARVLTGVLIRSLEAGDASSTTTDGMLKQIIPFLTSSSGMESSATEVRIFALRTLLDIVKKGNAKALRPYLGRLVAVNLVPSLSSMEPGEINYIQLNAEKYGLTEVEIDDARLSSVKMSPMMEAIERCIDMLDEVSMKDLSSHLGQTLKTVMGLPSNVGISRVLVSLSTRRSDLFRPYAPTFLKLLRRQLLDRNDTISTSGAAAGGYLCRIVESEAILVYLDTAKKLYINSEEDRHRTISGEMFLNVVKHATDRAQELASSLTPFIYLGMHDTNEPTREAYKSAWDELSGNSRTVLLFLSEIIALSSENLDSAHWSLKHASSFTVADVVKSSGATIDVPQTTMIWPALDKALSGRTWDGKEAVLNAFIQFMSKSSSAKGNPSIATSAKKIIIREAKRNNTGIYREQALKCLGDFTLILDTEDWFPQVSSIVESVLESLEETSEDMDVDAKAPGQPSHKIIEDQTRANAIRSLLQSLDPRIRNQSEFDQSIIHCLGVVKKLDCHKDAITQNAIFEGEKSLFDRLAVATHMQLSNDVFSQFLATLDNKEGGSESTRIKAAEAAKSMLALVHRRHDFWPEFRNFIQKWLEVDRAHSVQQILQRIQQELPPEG